MTVDDVAPLSPPVSHEGPLEPKPWVHDPSRPYLLPPGSNSATVTSLINTTLDIAHDYREFVDTLGKIEAEYGRALSVAVRKLEGKLDAAVLPAPGSSKSPEPTLVKAMRAHLVETSAIAGLHVKRPGLFHDQLIQPLQQLERRVNETSRRLSLWSKDIRGRWDSGRERVETARYKYHASVRDHDIALTRFRSCPAPTGTGKNEGEWVRLERLAAEAELNRADRKRAYLVALAGEGREGGGGWDMNEGGGSWGWGEESRALYGYVEFTMLEIIKHHAAEDSSHTSLLCHIMERAEKCYSNVCIATDQNAFLDWNTTDRSAKAGASGSNSNSPLPSPADSQSSVTPERSTSSMSNGRPLSVLAPIKSARPSSLTDHQRSSLTPSPNGEYPALSCLSFVPPPSAKDETPTFGTDKRADRNWLLNRWLQSNAVVVELEGADGKGGTLARKRRDIQTLREKCVAMTGARGTGDAGEVWERRIAVQRGMGEDERKVAAAKAEKACLEVFLGPDPAPELAHDLKDKQFATPSHCDACGQNVWSPLKSELQCRLCGIALHSKCALHVDPDCTGLKSNRRKGSSHVRRSITTRLRRQSQFESHGAPQEYHPAPTTIEPLREEELQVSPFVAPTTSEPDPPAILGAPPLDDGPDPSTFTVQNGHVPQVPVPTVPDLPLTFGRVIESYAACDQYQMNIWAGEILRVLKADVTGNGWVTARRGLDVGDEGLVPEGFLDFASQNTLPADGGSGTFVVCTFDFPPPNHTLGPGQACIRKHQLYELSDEGFGFDADWVELIVPKGSDGGRIRGIVPKSYVRPV